MRRLCDCAGSDARTASPLSARSGQSRAGEGAAGVEGVDRKMREGWLLTAPLAHWADLRVARLQDEMDGWMDGEVPESEGRSGLKLT